MTTALSGFIFWIIFTLNGGSKLWNSTPNTQNVSALLGVDTSPFFVADLPGRGKGLIASRDIEQGELLLREKPLFVVPRQVSSSPSALISGLLMKLNEDEQAAFYNLSYVNFPKHLDPDEHRDEVSLAIFQTNAVAAGDGVGIFPKMARINHGCSSAFNVVYTWREKEGALYVHALKSINRGQELLTSYTNSKRSRHDRRAFLAEHYGFECQCSVCSLSEAESRASDARLRAISEAYEEFAKWGEGRISGPEAIAQARKIWGLENGEGYWSERGRLAADATWVAASHSDAAATREWAAIAAEWYSYEVGTDSEEVGEMQAVVVRPDDHRAWGTRKRVEVGGLVDR
ncbi:SET domain-containing protein [Macrolepiota fuliginosa MF-IS2]|uniref:SET domain-containing protein n=1 Tax=Macrolepiota fuliginosa MF-IS2 TaxID=1400762 RepID=A0A9P5XS80_9AGAR|nr:SET domain-containing protein [Macrolepiota fuliginosa MF-IS2]